MVIKKIIYKISIYKVLPPYKNWYSIMTNDGLNRSNVVIIGKKQLLKDESDCYIENLRMEYNTNLLQ